MARRAKNAANQSALERLIELHQKTTSQSKFSHTIKRGIDSLAKCPHAVVTRKQALELKYVGPHLARIICPDKEHSSTESKGNEKKSSSSGSSSSNSAASASAAAKSTSSEASLTTTRRPLPTVTTTTTTDSSTTTTIKPSSKQIAYEEAREHAETQTLPSGPWKVILLLDGREQRAEHVQAKLQMSGVPCEQRHLPIGDMAWIARCEDDCSKKEEGNSNNTTKEKEQQDAVIEIMLGTIVERKQVDDLAASLFGTRYNEQRLRLQHCGLPQLLLLVEGKTSDVANCPADTLEMAMMATRVHLDNFSVVQTSHLDETVRFLKLVHRRILQRAFPSAFSGSHAVPSFTSPTARPRPRKKRRRDNKKESLADLIFDTPPLPATFDETGRFLTYQELKAKVAWDRERGTRTVGALHMAMLKQIPSLSHKKVQALAQAYPTPSSLLRAYDGLTSSSGEEGRSLVQDLSTNHGGVRECRVGPKSSAEVYHTYTQGGAASQQLLLVEEEDASALANDDLSRAKQDSDTEQGMNVSKRSSGNTHKKTTNTSSKDVAVTVSSTLSLHKETTSAKPSSHHASSVHDLLLDDDSSSDESISHIAKPESSLLDEKYGWEDEWIALASPARKKCLPSSSPRSPIQERGMAASARLVATLSNSNINNNNHVADRDASLVDLTDGDQDCKPAAVDRSVSASQGSVTMSRVVQSSQSSMEEEEPLWVRCQRRAGEQRRDAHAVESSSQEVIEIE